MGTSYWWIFDLLLIVIVIYVIVANAKRGVTKILLISIGYVFTTVAASLLAAIAAPTLYQTVAYDNNINGIVTANQHMDFVEVFSDAIDAQQYGFVMDRAVVKRTLTDPKKNLHFHDAFFDYATQTTGGPVSMKSDFNQMLYKAFAESYGAQIDERLPRYVRMYFDKQIRENPEIMFSLISVYYDNTKTQTERADVLEKMFAAKPTTEVLQIFIYLIIFSIIMAIIALISAILQNRIFLNIQKVTDHAVGGLLGIIEAGIVVVLLTLVVRLLVLLVGGKFLFFNDATIAESKLFSFFYDHIGIML